MTRFNYAQTPIERLLGHRPTLRIDARVRPALLALAIAMLFVGTLAAVELRRLSLLASDLSDVEDRIALAQRADARAVTLQRSIDHADGLRRAILAVQRGNVAAANDLTRLGNQLPADTWLTRVHIDDIGSWSIAGRSTGVERIGRTLSTIAMFDRTASTRLVSINAPLRSHDVLDFSIAWQRAR